MLEQDGQSNSPKQSSDLRNVVNRGVDGILQLVFEYGAEFPEGFVISAWLVQSQFLRMNLVDSNVHVDVIGVMVDDAHSLVFSVAQLAAEPLLDES
jgi:hypothetical protein